MMMRMLCVVGAVVVVGCEGGPFEPTPWPESKYHGDQVASADVDPLFRDQCFREWWTEKVDREDGWSDWGFVDQVKWRPSDWDADPTMLAYFQAEYEQFQAAGVACCQATVRGTRCVR